MRSAIICLGWTLIFGGLKVLSLSMVDDSNALFNNDVVVDDSDSLFGDYNDINHNIFDDPLSSSSLWPTENVIATDDTEFLLADDHTDDSCASTSFLPAIDDEFATGIAARGAEDTCKNPSDGAAVAVPNLPNLNSYTNEDERVRTATEVKKYWCPVEIEGSFYGRVPVCSIKDNSLTSNFEELLASTQSMVFVFFFVFVYCMYIA